MASVEGTGPRVEHDGGVTGGSGHCSAFFATQTGADHQFALILKQLKSGTCGAWERSTEGTRG